MKRNRQNPEQLLRVVNKEEYEKSRGHLKIFFGYAAGVGKTYAMLQAAHAAKRRGVDVVAGYVEPHARPQTSKLLHGLEQIPRRSVEHNGIILKEFDLDTAIARHPALILVDELAHTNADGCRHTKRYQDVEELLKAGIDVYTTVNVQHIESLNDIVATITGIIVRERIPDSVFDNANQVELVDIEPQELLERLQSGNVYQDGQAKRAVENFFTIENLIALREIALRRCADRVNALSDHERIKSGNEYHTDEHILVCLSSAPSNMKIIRTAARMVKAFRGTFTAIYVETPDFAVMDEEDRLRLRSNIRLAQQLGAVIETVYGDDVPFQIAEFARLSGVSKIVIGRSVATRRFFFGKSTLTEKLIAQAPNIDIHIIPDSTSKMAYKEKRNAFGVLVKSAVTTHRLQSLMLSIISVIAFNFFFVEPRFTLLVNDKGHLIIFTIMFISVFIASSLAVRLRRQAKNSARAAYRTKILFDTNLMLERAKERDQIISWTATQLMKLLGRNIIFYLAENGELSEPRFFGAKEDMAFGEYRSENEEAVAAWVLKNNKHAGATTDTLSGAKCLYLSIRTGDCVYGVLGIVINGKPLDAFESSILLSILGECALALENRQMREKRRKP